MMDSLHYQRFEHAVTELKRSNARTNRIGLDIALPEHITSAAGPPVLLNLFLAPSLLSGAG